MLTDNEPHTRRAIFTVERLHAELGGQILENRRRHEELSGQIRHVEAVVKMLDLGYNIARITVKRRKPNQHSLKNHEGKSVPIIGEGRPARWKLTVD
ncbi:hypothetical protein [Bradyrhizobium sp. AZCC 2289]|uniref:hypothetical protein n=1 Tax=Bradyrhizobium sp. AZCC 2289 TaxID=3117026 RepID=UPI002FEED71C